MNDIEEVSIEWESSGYSVLKNLKASILGIFTEFIDNSIQSYKNDKDKILKSDPNYCLEIKINIFEDEIIIQDNAGGIDEKNFSRALKPANRADDTKGLNEFGLGMKYAAVWISNEWELISSAYGENIERSVVFNYNDVVSKNLKKLPTKKNQANQNDHYTKVILRQLESSRLKGWKPKLIKEKLEFVYRNFLRENTGIYQDFCEDRIKIIWNGEKEEPLSWKEHNFLVAPWYKDVKLNKENLKKYEWKKKIEPEEIVYKETVQDRNGNRKEVERNVIVSGFVGILPDGDQKGKNGFVFFRRGRAVEGHIERIYPRYISGQQSRAFKYIRLYGEIHFKNVKVSFDKSQLNISNEIKDEIFNVISLILRKTSLGNNEQEFNLISQADNHRARNNETKSKKLKKFLKKTSEKSKTIEEELIEKQIAVNKYDKKYLIDENEFHKKIKSNINVNQKSKNFIGDDEYKIYINTSSEFSDSEKQRHKLYTKEIEHDNKEINITINENHVVFDNRKIDDQYMDLIIKFIKCLVISEVKASTGLNEAKDVVSAFNEYSRIILKNN